MAKHFKRPYNYHNSSFNLKTSLTIGVIDLEGEIIKFYRERQNLTQAQLGEGICTTTHVSTIERGKTAYSSEIISLFSERLSIDIEKEIDKLGKVEKLLDQWHQAIIMRRIDEMEQLKQQLEKITLVESPYYAAHYQLLKARYLIICGKGAAAFEIIEKVKKTQSNLTPYENNLLWHIYGIYYISDRTNLKSNTIPIQYLKKISIEAYGNKEYYYHLAIGYHLIGSYIMAYFFAEKALRYFKETNNYAQAINAENVMLLQMSRDMSVDFNDLVERYESLIHNSEILGLIDKKVLLLNNLGFEYFNKGDYESSKQCYEQALHLGDPGSSSYLLHLCNYIDACLESRKYDKKQIVKRIKDGLSLAKKLNSKHFSILFQLMKLKAENNDMKYFQFLEEKALPYFSSIEHIVYYNRYGKLLFNRYVETNQYMKATKLFEHQLS